MKLPRMGQNFQPSSLSFPGCGIIGVNHHTWFHSCLYSEPDICECFYTGLSKYCRFCGSGGLGQSNSQICDCSLKTARDNQEAKDPPGPCQAGTGPQTVVCRPKQQSTDGQMWHCFAYLEAHQLQQAVLFCNLMHIAQCMIFQSMSLNTILVCFIVIYFSSFQFLYSIMNTVSHCVHFCGPTSDTVSYFLLLEITLKTFLYLPHHMCESLSKLYLLIFSAVLKLGFKLTFH